MLNHATNHTPNRWRAFDKTLKQTIYILTLLALLTSCSDRTEKNFSFAGEKSFNLPETLKEAHDKDKKVLLYFSSLACVNCREIEGTILNNQKITDIINDEYLFVTLVVDDRTTADEKFWRPSIFSSDTLTKIGELYSQLQIELTQTGSQPLFAILSGEKETISTIGHTTNDEAFMNFLKKKEKTTRQQNI